MRRYSFAPWIGSAAREIALPAELDPPDFWFAVGYVGLIDEPAPRWTC